jgi:hypothetical protein
MHYHRSPIELEIFNHTKPCGLGGEGQISWNQIKQNNILQIAYTVCAEERVQETGPGIYPFITLNSGVSITVALTPCKIFSGCTSTYSAPVLDIAGHSYIRNPQLFQH